MRGDGIGRRRMPAGGLLLLVAGAGLLEAQLLPQNLAPVGGYTPILRGLQFYGVTGSASYLSTDLSGTGFLSGGSARFRDSDYLVSLGTGVGYTRAGKTSNFALMYSPSYFGSVRYADGNAVSHMLSVSTNTPRQLTRKLTFDFGVSGNMHNFQSFLFSPFGLTVAATSGANYSDLVNAFTRRTVTSDALAGALTSGPTLDQPTRLLFGGRTLSVGAQGMFSYQYSGRLSVGFGGGIMRSQTVSARTAGDASFEVAVPYVNAAFGVAQLSYGLSTRTTVGVSLDSSRSFSRNQDTWSKNVRAFVGHNFGRWFATAQAGVGSITPLEVSYAVRVGPQYSAAASIGMRTRTHVFLGSVDRSVGDIYGIGSHATLSAVGAWFWTIPGSSWGVGASFGQQRLLSMVGSGLQGWRGVANVTKILGAGFSLTAEYAYFDYQGQFSPLGYRIRTQAVRCGLAWSPLTLQPAPPTMQQAVRP